MLQPSPGNLTGPRTPDGQSSNLIGHLDGVTALIIAPQSSGSSAAFGTGFFVNDRHVVTNRHVIENADPARILVINKARGRFMPGKVVVATNSSAIGGDDFAVIEVEPEQNRPVMTLTTAVARGDSVVAAGFPSFIMSTDEGFRRVMANDLSAIPDPAVTQGWVTALQTSESGQGLLVHGATISQGNSGGTLSDLCGRSVGVNTFGRIDTENALRLNFALRTQGLRRFLSERQIPFSSDDTPCDPVRIQAAATPAQPGGGPAETPAPSAARPSSPTRSPP
jgi:S1-C subfamily serine protease